MLRYGSVLMLILAGLAALKPDPMAWVFIAAFIAFEVWLYARMRSVGQGGVAVGEPPYEFTAEEAEFVRRYRFYFTYPAIAANASSMLAAIGLSGIVLALWLTFRHAFAPSVLIGLNLFAVGWLTRQAAPIYGLRISASRGNREALRMLELLNPLWAKIKAANRSAESPS